MEASVAEQCSIRNLSIMPFTSPSYIAAAQCSSNTERSAVALLVWILAIGILFFFCFLGSSDDHFVGYGVGKENHQIRIPNFFS